MVEPKPIFHPLLMHAILNSGQAGQFGQGENEHHELIQSHKANTSERQAYRIWCTSEAIKYRPIFPTQITLLITGYAKNT